MLRHYLSIEVTTMIICRLKINKWKKKSRPPNPTTPWVLEKIISKHAKHWKKWSIYINSIGPFKFTNLPNLITFKLTIQVIIGH